MTVGSRIRVSRAEKAHEEISPSWASARFLFAPTFSQPRESLGAPEQSVPQTGRGLSYWTQKVNQVFWRKPKKERLVLSKGAESISPWVNAKEGKNLKMKTSQLCLFQGGTWNVLLSDGPFASAVKRSSLRPTPEDSFHSWHKRFLSKPVPLTLTWVYKLKRRKHKSGIPLSFSKGREVASDCFNPSKPVKMQTILLSSVF